MRKWSIALLALGCRAPQQPRAPMIKAISAHMALLDSLRKNDTSGTAIAGPLAETPTLLARYKDSLAVVSDWDMPGLLISRSFDSTLTFVTWDNSVGDHPIPDVATMAILKHGGDYITSMVPDPPCLSTFAGVCPSFFYYEIYPYGSGLYLATGGGKDPGPYPLRVASAFRVESGRLVRADIFPVLDSGDEANLFYEYDPRAVNGEDPEIHILGDTVLYPMITQTPDGVGFKGQYKILLFDGSKFTLSSAVTSYTSSPNRP